MKNFWLTFFGGIVEVKIIGTGVERLVNRLSKIGVAIFQFKKIDKEISLFEMRLSDVGHLRKMVRGQALKVTFTHKKGIPFLFSKFMRNKGIIYGIPFFIVIIFVLSNIVWSIQIDGASIETELKIRKQLKQLDVKIGKFSFKEGDPKAIQKKLTDEIPNITWIGVQSQGAVYRLKVVEKLIPKVDDNEAHPVLVKKKQLVEVGQPLVDGYIGTQENPKYVGAKGIVLGETWYQTTSEVPLKIKFQRLTGNSKTNHHIKVFNLSLPFWGFTSPKFKEISIEQTQTFFHFWKWKLPISLKKTQYNEVVVSTRILTEVEGEKLAKENAYLDLLRVIPPNAKVMKINLLQKQISSDKVRVMMHYEVIEDIATGSDGADDNLLSEPN
ncbi:MAG: yqfD [Bacillales bacterium]|nr:yqfD [Bacillales bacterium]